VNKDLYIFRVRTARCFGEASGSESRKLVLRIIRSYYISEKNSDFGAWTGELVKLLAQTGRFDLFAVDCPGATGGSSEAMPLVRSCKNFGDGSKVRL
jgi:hypothetical protein